MAAALRDIEELWARTYGDPEICVAVLDGLVDLAHSCFEGANLRQLTTLVQGQADPSGLMSLHGTHITSVIFGQPNCPAPGIAPRCKGLIVPVFADDRRKLSQLDLARAINTAREAGAQVINFSGGQLTSDGDAEVLLQDAVRACESEDVLLVAAAGNDGCDCLHVPAALPAVLAVGAMNEAGQPLDFSNWGASYGWNGILAPGENILGAKPGGGAARMSGTSFAAPIISGVAALLLSLLKQQGKHASPQRVRQALLRAATPCDRQTDRDCRRILAGKLNIPGTLDALGLSEVSPTNARKNSMNQELQAASVTGRENEADDQGHVESAAVTAACACNGVDAPLASDAVFHSNGETTADEPDSAAPAAIRSSTRVGLAPPAAPAPSGNGSAVVASSPGAAPSPGVTASQSAGEAGGNLVYALGTLGYDFGTEARRDSFKQLMPAFQIDDTLVPANPYDARQMVDYLAQYPSEALELIWTLNLELTPIYAIKPAGPYAGHVYDTLIQLMTGEVNAENDPEYIERVSIPGKLTGQTVRLFSGQVVPVIEPQNNRGLYGWKVNSLVEAAIESLKGGEGETPEDDAVRASLRGFLSKVYYDLRNLGATSRDRALNFAATNAFQASATFYDAVRSGMDLDTIHVEKSPFCRMDSDCWDVKLRFFDPENNRRARIVYRFTLDVSDVIPVTVGDVRQWKESF